MYLQVKVIPKARSTEFVEVMEDQTVKIRIKEAPENGKANGALLKFIAKAAGIKSSEVSIVSGHTDRRKLLKIPDNTVLPW